MKRWCGEEHCNICGTNLRRVPYFVDGKIRGATCWALMCSGCHEKYGVRTLGTGLGQKYDGKTFEKIEPRRHYMLLIYSGGMDSTVLLHEFKQDIKLAVHFNYGSKHNMQEVKCARINTERLGIPLVEIPLPFINELFKSDLLRSGGEVPEGHYEDAVMKRTVVPFRNGIMLAIAVGLADSKGLRVVLYANHGGDHAIYPDCREGFQEAMSRAARVGTYQEIRVQSPYQLMTKRQIAMRGQILEVPFNDTYSCYKGGDVHCGKCGTCVERKEALDGFDPTSYLP